MLIDVKVVPGSSKNELVKTEKGYRARVTCAPVDGKANEALVVLLSKEFGIPKSDIEIIKGRSNRNKTIRVDVRILQA